MTVDAGEALPFTYEEYSDWFDDYAARFLVSAKAAAIAALNQHLDDELQEPLRVRVRVTPGRVKSKTRTWKKLNDRYRRRVTSLSEIPDVVDDLVGLRVVCTNRSDTDRVVELLEDLGEHTDGDEPVLAVVAGSVKDWRDSPKDSGYRAYHVNLCTSVPLATTRHPIVCELQVRTLLQDSWGELTHEDTYKPGATDVPPLVTTLSRRMADLMATIDDVAEDLRSEIDSQEKQSLDSGPNTAGKAVGAPTQETASSTREAARAYLVERIAALKRPIDLATLAWELQREFGSEIAGDWAGYGTFKAMVESVPDARVSHGPPSWAIPADFDLSAYDGRHPGFPRAVSLLKDADRYFPLIPSEQWPNLYEVFADATKQDAWLGPTTSSPFNELTKNARDSAAKGEDRFSRAHIKYVTFALAAANSLKPNMSAEQVEEVIVKRVMERSADLGLSDGDAEQLEAWIRGKGMIERSTIPVEAA